MGNIFSTNSQLTYGDPNATFKSRQELNAAIADPRYGSNLEYTKWVNQTADRSAAFLAPTVASENPYTPSYHQVKDARNPNAVTTENISAQPTAEEEDSTKGPQDFRPSLSTASINTSTGRIITRDGGKTVLHAPSSMTSNDGEDGPKTSELPGFRGQTVYRLGRR